MRNRRDFLPVLGRFMQEDTYREDLINKQDPLGPIHPDVKSPDHANYPHYDIKLPDGDKAAIMIGEDRSGINWFNTTYGDE